MYLGLLVGRSPFLLLREGRGYGVRKVVIVLLVLVGLVVLVEGGVFLATPSGYCDVVFNALRYRSESFSFSGRLLLRVEGGESGTYGVYSVRMVTGSGSSLFSLYQVRVMEQGDGDGLGKVSYGSEVFFKNVRLAGVDRTGAEWVLVFSYCPGVSFWIEEGI